MLKELFSSRARIAVLKLVLLNQAKTFYQREMAAQTSLPIRAIQREVARLLRIGLLEKSVSGNRVYYQINKNCPIYPELKSIILKASGIASLLKRYLQESKPQNIRLAFIYGSYARNTENLNSDIDLVIIGGVSARKVSGILAPAKSELKREINSVLYSEQEFRRKLSNQDHFLKSVIKEPKIFLIGSAHDLKRLVQRR